jgi:dienelactone hydrolase
VNVGEIMSTIALFHPSFGITQGIRDAERRLSASGHDVRVVDYYGDGKTFNDYDKANDYVSGVGFPTLMQKSLDAVSDLPDHFIVLGFSNGAGMATYVALRRKVAAAVLCSGALPLNMIGADHWPQGVPAQLHYMVNDRRKIEGAVESVMASVNAAGADAEYFQYPGSGHLFTDPGLPEEYDTDAAERLWKRIQAFCEQHGA